MFYPSSKQGRHSGSLPKQGTARPIPSLLPLAICRGGRSPALLHGCAVERKPAELCQRPVSTESSWAKTVCARFCFSAAPHCFVCSPGEGVCFLGIGLLPLFSLSRVAQREDGPTLSPSAPGQLAGPSPELWVGVEPFAFVLLGYCCFLSVISYFFTYISSHLSLLIGGGERLKLRGGSLSWSLHPINCLKLRQWANKGRCQWC